MSNETNQITIDVTYGIIDDTVHFHLSGGLTCGNFVQAKVLRDFNSKGIVGYQYDTVYFSDIEDCAEAVTRDIELIIEKKISCHGLGGV